MDDVGILFFALLAVLCQVFVAVVLFLWIGQRLSPALDRAWNALLDTVAPVALWFVLAVSTVTMIGSLYLSEVKLFLPCFYCWIQRGFLYPIVPLAALGVFVPSFRNWARRLIVLLALLCVPVSTYHVLIEWMPSLTGVACDPNNPCSAKWYPYVFGYIGTPLMALTSAITVIVLTLMSKRADSISTPQENSNG